MQASEELSRYRRMGLDDGDDVLDALLEGFMIGEGRDCLHDRLRIEDIGDNRFEQILFRVEDAEDSALSNTGGISHLVGSKR